MSEWEIPFFFSLGVCIYEKSRIFEAFFESTIFNMSHIFGNMVYLNIKERDRF